VGEKKSKLIALRPRARILRTLGEELISSETVAVIELVKNAYDADATRVLICFNGPLEVGKGSIEIFDNGHGMSFTTVLSGWMELATYMKRRGKRLSEGLKRRMLGEKGIGRFAAARLAGQLELITRRKSSPSEVHAIFDWTQFEDESKYLDEIEILAEERKPADICSGGSIKSLWLKSEGSEKSKADHGTILRMTGLKQNWENEDFEDLQRGLSRLIPPYKQESDFKIMLELPDKFSSYTQEIAPPRIIKYPHYTVNGTVDALGNYDLLIEVHESGAQHSIKGAFQREAVSPKLLMVDQKELNNSIENDEKSADINPACGPLNIELLVWNRDELGNIEQMTNSTIADVRHDLDSIAGINIYRDDFRVLPYGEPNNDWLRLDIRRVQKPTYRLSNNQIVGYIKITADENPELHDQSNREGLDENQALSDLRMIMLHVLTKVESIRYKQRPRDKKKRTTPLTSLFASFDLTSLREHLLKEYPRDVKAMQVLDSTQQLLNKQLDEIQTVLARYHRLATLGQIIDVVLHDGRQPIATILNEAIHGREDIEDAQNENGRTLPLLHKHFKLIEQQAGILSTVFRRMEPFGGRRRGRPSQLYLEKIIHDAFGVFQTQINELNVKVSLPHTETLVRVDAAEFEEVIVNLLQNSLYWLQHVSKAKREIGVSVKRIAPDNVQIVFADSGPGVPEGDREHIFEPYFSTKPDGVGLGLTIAGEIVSDYYGGNVELMDSDRRPGATFRITLRKRV